MLAWRHLAARQGRVLEVPTVWKQQGRRRRCHCLLDCWPGCRRLLQSPFSCNHISAAALGMKAGAQALEGRRRRGQLPAAGCGTTGMAASGCPPSRKQHQVSLWHLHTALHCHVARRRRAVSTCHPDAYSLYLPPCCVQHLLKRSHLAVCLSRLHTLATRPHQSLPLPVPPAPAPCINMNICSGCRGEQGR